MNWAIDIDGVITANPSAISWLTYHLLKNENKNNIYILTWRDGSDKERIAETEKELYRFNIYYTQIIYAPRRFTSSKIAAFWKIKKIKELKINIWLDDEIKSYHRDLGIDLNKLLPEVNKIWI